MQTMEIKLEAYLMEENYSCSAEKNEYAHTQARAHTHMRVHTCTSTQIHIPAFILWKTGTQDVSGFLSGTPVSPNSNFDVHTTGPFKLCVGREGGVPN